jgi:hypothetical protein
MQPRPIIAYDVLRIAQIEQVTNFDPALMSTQDMGVLIDTVYEGLIGTERDTVRIVPRLAEKWALSLDSKSMTFVLRKSAVRRAVRRHVQHAADGDRELESRGRGSAAAHGGFISAGGRDGRARRA